MNCRKWRRDPEVGGNGPVACLTQSLFGLCLLAFLSVYWVN